MYTVSSPSSPPCRLVQCRKPSASTPGLQATPAMASWPRATSSSTAPPPPPPNGVDRPVTAVLSSSTPRATAPTWSRRPLGRYDVRELLLFFCHDCHDSTVANEASSLSSST